MTSEVSKAETVDTEAAGLRTAIDAALDLKASDLVVLNLEELCDFTDFFVVCSGSNRRQVAAIADAISSKLRDASLRPLHAEGIREGQWVLLDYGDFVFHVFDQERRDFYRLERLWADAPNLTEQFIS
ncbi:MAG: ribosome silencing factor [Acidobacteriota bacterium]